jgi:hypothetical protein
LSTPAEYLMGGLDASGECISLSSGAWSAIKLLGLGLAQVGRPASIDCWSWTVSRRAITRLTTWAAEGVDVRVVVDASLWRRQATYGAALLDGLSSRVRAASAHVKAARVSGPTGSIFIAGSGNLNLCRRAELVFLSRDPRLSEWLGGLTDTLFATLPAGAPRVNDEVLNDRLATAFPSAELVPNWAEGLPRLGGR